MPTYEVPLTAVSSEDAPISIEHEIYIPASKEIMEAFGVDDPVFLEIKGSVMSVSNDDMPGEQERYSMRVKLKEVKASAENEFEQMAREDDDEY